MKIKKKQLKKLVQEEVKKQLSEYNNYDKQRLDNAIPGKDFIHTMESVLQGWRRSKSGGKEGLIGMIHMKYLDMTNDDYVGLEEIKDDIEGWVNAHI